MKKSLKKLRNQAKNYYKSLDSIYCPYFKEAVHFTSEGFSHIKYRGAHQRHFNVQKIRYQLLRFAPRIISDSNTLQEYDRRKLFVKRKKEKICERALREIHFFAFIAIVDSWKVKVVVRQIGNGQKHFWSVIPNWKTRRSRDGRKSFYNYTGDLACD